MNPNRQLSITKEQIAALPQANFEGEIVTIDTLDAVAAAVAELADNRIIGFDTETKPSFKKGSPNKVALMQLSTDTKCFLFRLNKIGIPPELCQLMERDDVVKIGLSVHDDFHVMHRICEFTPGGFIELQTYVKDFQILDISLQKIYAIIFNEKISKKQRLTNWEASELTEAQQLYAATDAWACLKIYRYLSTGKFNPDECPYEAPEPQPAPEPAQKEAEAPATPAAEPKAEEAEVKSKPKRKYARKKSAAKPRRSKAAAENANNDNKEGNNE